MAITYKAILVFDVSRWGRLQDIDEAAHYEFLCRSAGVTIHYRAEPFVNDASLPSMIMKALKRMMAYEYSRELSAKVYAGASRLAQLGFKQGGVAGYGYRRMLVSVAREPKVILLPGQRKSIQEDRVILVPGPQEEVDCIREIFRMFVAERKMPKSIAAELNARGYKYPGVLRHEWYPQAVNRVLRNTKYTGTCVYGAAADSGAQTRSRPENCFKCDSKSYPDAARRALSPETSNARPQPHIGRSAEVLSQ